MRNHKVYLVLLSVLVLSLGIAACGQPASMKPAETTAAKEDKSDSAPDQTESTETEADSSEDKSEASSSEQKTEAASEEAGEAETSEVKVASRNAEAAEVESPLELRTSIDNVATYQEVIAQEDGSFAFQELAIPDFAAWVAAQSQPVFIDFWAPWCQPCLLASPEVDKLAETYGSDLRVIKANVEGLPGEVVAEYRISGIPRFVLVQDQKIQDQWEGFGQGRMDQIRESIDKLIG